MCDPREVGGGGGSGMKKRQGHKARRPREVPLEDAVKPGWGPHGLA